MKRNGVLVISEFAGASVELPYAIRTNPYDTRDMVNSLVQALSLDEEEKNYVCNDYSTWYSTTI